MAAPTTAGMRYSRATTAQWLRMPPVSVTTAAAVANSGVHGGDVVSATSTSPGRRRAAAARERATPARPRPTPGGPGAPRRGPGAGPARGGAPQELAAP